MNTGREIPITIIENSSAARREYGYHSYESDLVALKPVHLKALQDGKCLAWANSEYSTFVIFINKPKELSDGRTSQV